MSTWVMPAGLRQMADGASITGVELAQRMGVDDEAGRQAMSNLRAAGYAEAVAKVKGARCSRITVCRITPKGRLRLEQSPRAAQLRRGADGLASVASASHASLQSTLRREHGANSIFDIERLQPIPIVRPAS